MIIVVEKILVKNYLYDIELNDNNEQIVATMSRNTADYKKETINRKETRARASGYVKALADAQIITEQERKVLFCYITVQKGGKE